jgi:hypothetical protein
MTSSPRPVAGNFGFSAPVMLPVIAGKDVVWDVKPEKRGTDLSGTLSSFLYLLFLVIIGYFHFASKFGAKSRRGSEICAYFLVCLSTISSLRCLSFCSLCFISSGKWDSNWLCRFTVKWETQWNGCLWLISVFCFLFYTDFPPSFSATKHGFILWIVKLRTQTAILQGFFNWFSCFSTEVEMMKERFAKLLLGEDMSGGGKGVCTALAISNAITNLSGQLYMYSIYEYVFGMILVVMALKFNFVCYGSDGVWWAVEVRATGAAEEGNVAPRNGVALMRKRFHSWARAFHTTVSGWGHIWSNGNTTTFRFVCESTRAEEAWCNAD